MQWPKVVAPHDSRAVSLGGWRFRMGHYASVSTRETAKDASQGGNYISGDHDARRTRYQVGEIHYHAHILSANFAKDPRTGRTVSLNGNATGNGPARWVPSV